jgi:hypothetical protein
MKRKQDAETGRMELKWRKKVGGQNISLNAHRLRINFPFRWFRLSLRTWVTAALTWAEGEHTWAEGEHAGAEPEQAWASLSRAWAKPEQAWAEPEQSLSILSTPWVSLRTIMWNQFWPPVCPGYSFLTEFCPGSVFAPSQGFCRSRF